jgi:hypothetical protein
MLFFSIYSEASDVGEMHRLFPATLRGMCISAAKWCIFPTTIAISDMIYEHFDTLQYRTAFRTGLALLVMASVLPRL